MSSTHGIYKEFDNQMKAMIRSYANNNPAPVWGTICNISENEEYVDVNVNGGTLKAVTRFGGKPQLNGTCVIIFINGSYEHPVAICNSYTGKTPCYNLIKNGCFQKRDNGSPFDYWTGGTISTKNFWYNESTARILPNQHMTSDTVNITSLKSEDEELSEIMVFYYYLGEIELEIIDMDTNNNVVIAPESLELTKEVLEPVDTWHYARTHFLIRDHKRVKVRFTNASSSESAYIDGIRIWSPDFEYWYPSKTD